MDGIMSWRRPHWGKSKRQSQAVYMTRRRRIKQNRRVRRERRLDAIVLAGIAEKSPFFRLMMSRFAPTPFVLVDDDYYGATADKNN